VSRSTNLIAVAGYGAVGREIAQRLSARGDEILIVQRQKPSTLPKNAKFKQANLEGANETKAALAGIGTVVCAVGIPYVSKIYTRVWPIVMRNMLDACGETGARFVFVDNLYMYGPVSQPMTEDTPLTSYGRKPRVRAEITRMWQEAHNNGRVRAVAVRASDFYGPNVPTSVLSTQGVVRLLNGKSAIAPYPADNPHDITYIPDFARAVETLIDAPDDAYGQAWHVPNAPTRTLRELMMLAATMIGVPPRVTVLGPILGRLLGLFRQDVRELGEMRFQWDRPYLVDTTKFTQRFWHDPTPFEQGLKSTIAYYSSAKH